MIVRLTNVREWTEANRQINAVRRLAAMFKSSAASVIWASLTITAFDTLIGDVERGGLCFDRSCSAATY